MPEQLQKIIDNLSQFGPKKLAIMGGVAALVMAIIGVASFYLNRPAYETLYVGLERSDVNQIGLVLGESGITFDVESDGTSVLVEAGKTAQARMLLAEKGLPTSTNAGYELFDNVGSLGLTSFMQQVTRVRALEGEIARTIQSIAGIKAARVHIVMSERANFRREEQQPSASVVIRTSGVNAERSANAIRHMVAAAVPGLNADKVTILDASGELLAAGDDPANNAASRSLTVEQTVESQIEENIRRALSPYLGHENFRASVRAEVNTDVRQIQETTFDPDSRVERSVQVVKLAEQASERSSSSPATVEQNLPDATPEATTGPESSEQSERREETTNYELNSKRIETVSNGYTVDRLSISVVVNRARLTELLGANAAPDAVDARIAEIRNVVASATGFTENRGDLINVAAVEFIDGLDGADASEAGILDSLGQHAGTMINAAAFVVVVFLVVWFGIRPMTAALTGSQDIAAEDAAGEAAPRSLPNLQGQSAAISDAARPSGSGAEPAPAPGIDDLHKRIRPGPQERLARMVDLNEERTAQILRKWSRQEAA
ncbi:MAG: flagellar M-ring protein FliF [Rhizobiaceae bacterium]|nr:flagellar M-ring protein FliF [Rhizobiaceae bacterium]